MFRFREKLFITTTISNLPEEGGATSRNNALFDGGPGGAESVVDSVLGLVDLDLGGASDLEDGHSRGQPCHALLKLLFLVLGAGALDGVPSGIQTRSQIISLLFLSFQQTVILNQRLLDYTHRYSVDDLPSRRSMILFFFTSNAK